ncbi:MULTISPECIES: enoyl-CoA hydratase-related protein [Pseudomonas]|uniref:enoyl-CoA hydratase-related protein n=1 Tax=Pseudomonas TaxID=286 RepID=UPI0028DFBA60|nr:enoyl-CoA hydratase-related protein [Pseudomonas taiwanensis]MDT8924509.1 enoyl-CoA hydratase-related protein [Pseudomonas taiwanensis]
MTTYDTVELEVSSNNVATVWLNRPDKNNAFNAQMIGELIAVFRELRDDPRVRFMVLRGQGKHFSAGADLSWMQASAALDYEANLQDAHELGELMSLLHNLPFPTLAAVHGAAFGGAVGLISCCDIAVGTPDAIFSLSEVRIGLVPAVISPYVVKAIGQRAARRYALTAERFSGVCAQTIGLLAEIYEAGELDGAVELLTATLLQNSPQAMRVSKSLLEQVGNGVLSPELRRITEETIATVRVSEEGQEGLNAFLQKRKPSWV